MKAINKYSLITIVIVAIMTAVLLTLGTGKAGAQLGNSGVPVRCFKIAPISLAPSEYGFLNCIASDGTPFVDGQRVPAGYYLLVTDVLIMPVAGTATTGLYEVTVFDAYGTNERQSYFKLRNTTPSSFGASFNAPYLVLDETHRLEIFNASLSDHSIEIRISGFLVTNLTYLPMTSK